jgi:UDP-N-acetylmuramate dehydrogenase
MEKINIETGFSGLLRYDEPMAPHTTFKVGGPADVWVQPGKDSFPSYAAALLGTAREQGIPVFILGSGANIVVSDQGIRGIVLDTGAWSGVSAESPDSCTVRSGTGVDALVDLAAARGWGGFEFLAGMPGSVGGAVWMNARCYERSVSGLLIETGVLDFEQGGVRDLPIYRRIPFDADDFGYKKSPFQGRDMLILSAVFRFEHCDPDSLDLMREEMASHRRDREGKGHFRFPCAGSVFKNSRDFGKPTGKLIDELGLLGLAVGDAVVAPWHGNIIINRGNASAADIRCLVDELMARVKAACGIVLEPEILFIP